MKGLIRIGLFVICCITNIFGISIEIKNITPNEQKSCSTVQYIEIDDSDNKDKDDKKKLTKTEIKALEEQKQRVEAQIKALKKQGICIEYYKPKNDTYEVDTSKQNCLFTTYANIGEGNINKNITTNITKEQAKELAKMGICIKEKPETDVINDKSSKQQHCIIKQNIKRNELKQAQIEALKKQGICFVEKDEEDK